MVAHTCPSDDQLLAFAEGLLREDQRAGVEQHLAGCSDCSAVLGATYHAPSDDTVIGRYRVQAELGRGGMGRVLQAHDPLLDRTVAIKLILPSVLSKRARDRFAREAETLGKLRDPNVVEIFDVGELDGAPYFVMEFVDGQNLDLWCRSHDSKEIIASLAAAGRGLASAHAAGVLHRDFKPSNVMVDVNGRVKVGDFGLAGFETAATTGLEGASVESLTKTGAVMGTLSYLAPELLDGGKASPASDQFAFCVTLHEALYGRRPFVGIDARALSASIRSGDIPPPPADRSVPSRVRKAILRGLSARPEDRFPSMNALLRALRPERGATKLGLVAGLGAAAVAGGAYMLAGSPPSACSGFRTGLEGIYDASQRERLRAAFRQSDRPYADATLRSTLSALDVYASQWVEGSTDACLATEEGQQSDRALDLRMLCFKLAAQRLDATVELLTAPSGSYLENGGELVASLPSLQLCSDAESLQQLTVLPADGAQSREADELTPMLSKAFTHTLVDDFQGASALLEEHRAALDAASYPPVRVRALQLRGRILLAGKELSEADVALRAAHALAVEHGLDRDGSRTATMLGSIASQRNEFEEAQRWFDVALALAEASGSDQLEAFALATSSNVHAKRGELDRAVEAARRSLQIARRSTTYPPTSRAEVLLTYARHVFDRGGGEDGLEELREAQELLVGLHGSSHPSVADVEAALQVRASRRGDYEAAFQHGQEVLRIVTAVHGPRSVNAIAGRVNLAVSLKELGRYEEAAATLRRADVLLAEERPDYPGARVPVLANLASTLIRLHDDEGARKALKEARALLEQTQTDHLERSIPVDTMLALVELRGGNLPLARRLASRALEVSQRIFGEDHFRTADAYARLAQVELEARNYARARNLLSRARAVQDVTEADRAEASFFLARALHEDPTASDVDRARAVALARDAHAALAGKPAYQEAHGDAKAWLDRHAPLDTDDISR